MLGVGAGNDPLCLLKLAARFSRVGAVQFKEIRHRFLHAPAVSDDIDKQTQSVTGNICALYSCKEHTVEAFTFA